MAATCPPLVLDPAMVKKWFQDEGIFAGDMARQEAVAGWLLRVPIDPQQTINLQAMIPKTKPDLLVLGLSIIPNPTIQELLRGLSDDQRQRFLKTISRTYLEALGMMPTVGLGPDQQFIISFGVNLYEDAPLTKHLAMKAVRRLMQTFLYFEITSEEVFRQFGTESELLKP